MRFSRQPQGEPTMAWVSVFFKSPLGSMQTPEQSLPVLGLAQTIPVCDVSTRGGCSSVGRAED